MNESAKNFSVPRVCKTSAPKVNPVAQKPTAVRTPPPPTKGSTIKK